MTTAISSDPRPFASEEQAHLVLPAPPGDHPDRQAASFFNELILREQAELEAEVGCSVQLLETDTALSADSAAILIGPSRWNTALRNWKSRYPDELPDSPYVAIDRTAKRVIVDAEILEQVGDAIQLLRTAIADRADVTVPSLCETAADVIERVDTEVRRTFPMLKQRVPEWDTSVRHTRASMRHPDDLAPLQRLMSVLNDAHSWAKDTRINGRLPYHVHDDGHVARLWDVPESSAAWAHGARPGDIIAQPDTAAMRERAGYTPHARPWTVGLRTVAGRVGEEVDIEVIRRDGSHAKWTETIPPLPWDEPITVDRCDSRTGYLRIRGWLNTPAWADAFTSALTDLQGYDRLVVDLRGNVGGALIAAQDARARFLSQRTLLGTIRFSTVTGAMSAPTEIVCEPPATGPRWTKPVRFIVDPLSYSATEDFLQGLQGLPHVQLIGQTTGGGSGRPRTIHLRPNLIATISTALTYDRSGRCIEGNGFTPDVPVAPDPVHPDAIMGQVLCGW